MPVDFDSIVRRVSDILQSNPKLKSRINKFRYGELKTIGKRTTPSECHIYTPTEMMSTAEQYGRSFDTDRQFTVYIDIKINGFAQKPDLAKKDMLEKVELATDALMGNPKLTNPDDGTDPLATRILVRGISEVPAFKGKLVPIAIIHVKLQIGSEITISISDVGDGLPVLFAPSGVEYVGYSEKLSTFGKLVGYAATTERKTRYYDLENTRDLFDKLSDLKDMKDMLKFTVNESEKETEYTGYLERVSPGQAYDGTPMITLQFAVL